MGWVVAIAESSTVEAESLPKADKQQSAVLIKGRGAEVAFNLDENAPLEEVARELDSQLAGQTTLFSKGGISVNTGNRHLGADEEEEIRRIFREKSGLKIARFVSATGTSADEQPGKSIHLRIEEDPKPDVIEESPVRRTRKNSTQLSEFSSADLARALSGMSSQGQRTRDQALVVRGTIRSGETVQHNGDLVVLGDVNPGSEVLADGDIVVMGSLKGLPHAGASGDNKAAVIALEIACPRLRIGGAQANAPAPGSVGARKRKQDHPAPQPTIAYIRQGEIHVSPFAGRFARYTKGVPYEG